MTAASNADRKERRFSPLRALVWKEWRQQRWIFVLMVVLAYALAVAGLFGSEVEMRRAAPRVLAGFVGMTAVLILSANAFAGERDENTERFLEMIPLSRSRVFWVKLGFVLALATAGLAPVTVWALASPASLSLWSPAGVEQAALVIPTGLVILAVIPALIASFGDSVITTILISLPVAGGCIAWVVISAGWFKSLAPPRVEITAWPTGALVVATLLLAARRLWAGPERSWRRRALTASVTASLVIAYAVGPMAAAYLYVTCFAPLSFFMRGGRSAGGYIASVSPSGKYTVANTVYRGWGEDGIRAALVNVETGRTQWLSRFHQSGFWWASPRLWTPSGERFVLQESAPRLCPEKLRRILGDVRYKTTWSIVDVRSGDKEGLDALCPGLKKMLPNTVLPLVGWYNDEVFAFQDGRDILFADTNRHTVHRCRKPGTFPDTRHCHPLLLPITQRGIFDIPGDGQLHQPEMSLLRFAPELDEAEVLTYKLPPAVGTPDATGQRQPPALQEIHVSQDGEWLLLSVWEQWGWSSRYYLARSQGGPAALLPLPGDPGDAHTVLSLKWFVDGFLPDSHQILFHGQHEELALLDADSRELRRIPLIETYSNRRISTVELSPQGHFALVGLTDGWGYKMADLRYGSSWTVSVPSDRRWSYRWVGEDCLLFGESGQVFVINRDGSDKRPLLSE